MPTKTQPSYPNAVVRELFDAILSLKNPEEAANFFRDLLTVAEIKEFANRWQMVKMLVAGKSYLEIAAELKTSTTTVSRVAHWFHHGTGGYTVVADRMFPKPTKFKDSRSPKPFRLRGKYTLLKNPYEME